MSPRQTNTRVEAWMHADVHVVRPHDPIDHARALCERHRVNQLPVVANGRLVGIVTDRDLRDAFPSVIAEATDPVEAHRLTAILPVDEVMTRGVITVTEADDIELAATIMRRERVGALPVVRDGRLVGILTRSDLLDALVALAHDQPVRVAS
jgi:acetoin utilization protein AcuB